MFTITVGLDGSPESLAAADWAAHEAQQRGLPLRLVHGGEQMHYLYAPLSGVPAPDAIDAQREWAAYMLGETEARLAQRHPRLRITTGTGHRAQGTGQDLVDHAPADLLVRPQGDTQQVPPGGDADEPVLLVDHGQAVDVVAFHHAGGVRDALFGVDRDGGRRHQLACGRGAARGCRATGGGSVGASGATARAVCGPGCLTAYQVGAGDHAQDLVVVVHHGQALMPCLSSSRATSLNDVSRGASTTSPFITSPTVRLMSVSLPRPPSASGRRRMLWCRDVRRCDVLWGAASCGVRRPR
jgi:nucleotide-binding universal stress UspA family protein